MQPPVMCILGTRPEAIKMAPVILALKAADIPCVVVSTAQHRHLLDQVLELFEITPDVDLDLMTPNQTLSTLTVRCLSALDELISKVKPSCIVAQGDTTTVFCAALTAFYQRIPFAHVEAGLRSGNIDSPFPEEWNRIAAGRLASLHFAPTEAARQALQREGVPDDAVLLTGNTVIDAVEIAKQRVKPDVLPGLDGYALVTLHRRENFGAPVLGIIETVRDLARKYPNFGFVWPVHPNPNVRPLVHQHLGDIPNIVLSEPKGYVEFLSALSGCHFALSDSGGVQEEAPSFGKPVLVLRTETERPEGIEAGVAKLVGIDPAVIRREAEILITDAAARAAMRVETSPYGDGKASERIVAALSNRFFRKAAA
jgi:UDP-N-acetylglucosamine 2-epimerase (non-hydrolysing)